MFSATKWFVCYYYLDKPITVGNIATFTCVVVFRLELLMAVNTNSR